MQQNQYLLRFPEIKRITGLSRSTIFRLEKSGLFPKRKQISSKTIGWLSNEIQNWVSSRLAPVPQEGSNG